MAEPQDITRSPNLLVTLMSWAEAGGVVEPSAGRKSTGEIPNDLYTSNEHNWLGREPMRWLRALFSRYLSSGEALVSSWFVDKGTGIWSDDAVGPLEGFLSDGPAGTASLVTDLWLDPDGTGGVRVQVNAAKASPAQFLANKDTYIFVPIDLIVPPTVSEPELALLDVPVGFAAPATPAGFVLVWRVETDGAGIVDQEIFLPDFPVLKQVGFEIISAAIAMIAGDLDVGGNVEIDGTLDVTGAVTCDGAVTLGDAAGDAISLLGTTTASEDVTINAILTVNDTANLTMDVNLGTDQTTFGIFNLNCTLGNSAAYSHTVNGALTVGSTDAETLAINSSITTVLIANAGITGATGNPVALPEGATVAAGKDLGLETASTITGDLTNTVTAGIFDTVNETGIAKVGSLDLYLDATPGATGGRVQWNGKRLTVGNGASAEVIHAPFIDYLDSASTTSAGTDITSLSGSLNITANVPPSQDVYITLEAHQFVDAVDGGLLRIRGTNGVDSVSQLKLGSDDAAVSVLPDTAAPNQRRPNSIRLRWRPTDDFPVPNNDIWTFFAQHGVSNLSNLKTTAATLMVQFL